MDELLDINKMIEMVPAIKEKSIIDFVNIISVNNDVIRTRKDRGFFSNIFASVTGKNTREINLMFENINTQFEAVYDYFHYFEENQARSLSALNIVTEFLIETRIGVMKLQDRFYENINKIEQKIDSLKRDLEDKIKRIDLKIEAKNEIDAEFNKLNLGYFNDFSILERVKIILENIYFGSTGNLFKKNVDEKFISDMKINIKAKIKDYLSDNYKSDTLNRKDLFMTQNKSKKSKLLIDNLFNYDLPFAKAIFSVDKSGFEILNSNNYSDLPFYINKEILTNRLFDEIIDDRKYLYE